MIFQALIQVTDGESNIVLHWAVIRMLEMQQVHGTLGRHRNMITRDDAREQVRKSIVKSRLTPDPCMSRSAYAMLAYAISMQERY